ncbi:MAG: type IV pilus assembly protein PilQ [Lentimonas sp.]|jgi:type IV pilus assembly protein PilQ
MKKRNTIVSLLVVPLALFAQSSSAGEKALDIEIPNVRAGVLSDDAEVVLDLPGQGLNSGEVSMEEEETISVDFPDEDVRTILRSVADLYDLNLVVPDSLQGRTSIKLRNITWDQVFEVVLDPLGYTFIEDRNIIRVKSIEELTAEPVDTRVFIANYARAEELKSSIEPLIDPAAGGNIQVDIRSNALVIKERPSRMGQIEQVIRSLDQPTEQVMIESKFIEVTNTDVQNIGINWSSLSKLSVAVSGGVAGTALGGIGGATTSFVRNDDDGETKADAAVLSADQFDAVISALDNNSDVELVSNPTVVALNNTKANITIAERFPFPQYSFNAQTGERQIIGFEYIDIGIKLDVTPSVNKAGFINLNIIPEVSNSTGTFEVEEVEIPIISSRRTESNITIKDGYTLAIGGLVESTVETDVSKVPLLGSLPGIGRLFRSNSDSTSSTNLIIFITAKTLNPDGSDYRDVVDPRILNEMQIIPSDLPGYELPSEDLKVLKEIEELRNEAKNKDEIELVQDEIDLIKKAKLKAEKKSKKK